MRERELKRADKAAAYANTLSLPMRERELKPTGQKNGEHHMASLPTP